MRWRGSGAVALLGLVAVLASCTSGHDSAGSGPKRPRATSPASPQSSNSPHSPGSPESPESPAERPSGKPSAGHAAGSDGFNIRHLEDGKIRTVEVPDFER